MAYNVTDYERDLALRLGVPIYGADPKFCYLGSKTGSREVFEAAVASHPLGYGNLRSFDDVHRALRDVRRKKPDLTSAMVKLNEGVSGEGNATIDLTGLPDPNGAEGAHALEERIRDMQCELTTVNLDDFFQTISEVGGIVEERIEGCDFHSPSVQMRFTPLGEVEVLSTHDQILGGPSGQSFLGSRFPANPQYGPLIGSEGPKDWCSARQERRSGPLRRRLRGGA